MILLLVLIQNGKTMIFQPEDNKPEPKNGLKLNEEDKKLINSLPEESNVEQKDEHLGKRLKRLF